FSPVRPNGYAAFLAAYRRLFDDFAHLPAVQLGCYVAAVWLLAIGIALRTQNFIAAATTLIVALWLTDTTSFPYVLSDSLYAALLIAAAACFLFYAETGHAGALLAASAGIGAALTFRTIGLALLPAFLIAAFIPSLTRRRHPLMTAALILLPIAGFYGAADEYGRGQFAACIAAAYAAQDPVGLLHRTAIDLLGLWVMPRWLTEGEQEAMQAELDNTGGLPFLAGAVPPTDAATEAALGYYKIVPDPTDH